MLDIARRVSTFHEIYPIHQNTEKRRIPNHLKNHASISQDLHASNKKQTKYNTRGQGLLDQDTGVEEIVHAMGLCMSNMLGPSHGPCGPGPSHGPCGDVPMHMQPLSGYM